MTKEELLLEREVMERIIIGEQIEIDRLEKEIKELRQQIEKMRCCANCKHSIYYACELKECGNLDRWELAE